MRVQQMIGKHQWARNWGKEVKRGKEQEQESGRILTASGEARSGRARTR